MRMLHMATRTTVTATRMKMMPITMGIMITARMITAMTITTMMNIAATTITTTITTVIPMLMTTNESANIGSAITEREAAALYRLMTWLSPAFPVGGFSYSSGIEWAVEAGDITDAASLEDWLDAMLVEGSGFCDGVFLSQAHRAAEADDEIALRAVAELSAAFVPSRERQLETTAQGRAFIDIARAAWNCDGLDEVIAKVIATCGAPIVYPVAVGLVSAVHDVPLAPTLHAYLHALVSNWISAGSRLIPLGQTDCQRVLAALEPAVEATARRALSSTLDDLGSATFRADLASLRHETQYTRLFRS